MTISPTEAFAIIGGSLERDPVPAAREAAERHKAFHSSIQAKAKQLALPTSLWKGSSLTHIGSMALPLVRTAPVVPKRMLPAYDPATAKILAAQETWREWRQASGKITVIDIQRAVAERYGLAVADILGPSRKWPIVKPRQVAMYLAKRMTNRSLPDIGRRFNGFDHTTILHAYRKIERLSKTDANLRADLGWLWVRAGGGDG